VSSKDILLMCRTNVEDIRQPGWVGCALAFLALCKVGLCVGVLCALQCAKNSVGSCRQSHGCLYMCRMFNRVTNNEQGFVQAGNRCWSSP
jgi:hypothetical protein